MMQILFHTWRHSLRNLNLTQTYVLYRSLMFVTVIFTLQLFEKLWIFSDLTIINNTVAFLSAVDISFALTWVSASIDVCEDLHILWAPMVGLRALALVHVRARARFLKVNIVCERDQMWFFSSPERKTIIFALLQDQLGRLKLFYVIRGSERSRTRFKIMLQTLISCDSGFDIYSKKIIRKYM